MAQAEHAGDGGAGDVGVQDAHAHARARELGGQDARDHGLAHAALAGHDADHMSHVAQVILLKGAHAGVLAVRMGAFVLIASHRLPFTGEIVPLATFYRLCHTFSHRVHTDRVDLLILKTFNLAPALVHKGAGTKGAFNSQFLHTP